MQQAYDQVMSRLRDVPAASEALTSAQRSWLVFRDRECAFMTIGVSGGSVRPMLRSMCLEAMTVERTNDLNALLDCKEGDLDCPVPPPR